MLLIYQFFAQPAFAQKYGNYNPNTGFYEIPTRWQTALSMSINVGNILGLQVTGFAVDRLGYRLTMLIALVCMTGFLFLQFFAINLGMLLSAYILLGVSIRLSLPRYTFTSDHWTP